YPLESAWGRQVRMRLASEPPRLDHKDASSRNFLDCARNHRIDWLVRYTACSDKKSEREPEGAFVNYSICFPRGDRALRPWPQLHADQPGARRSASANGRYSRHPWPRSPLDYSD